MRLRDENRLVKKDFGESTTNGFSRIGPCHMSFPYVAIEIPPGTRSSHAVTTPPRHLPLSALHAGRRFPSPAAASAHRAHYQTPATHFTVRRRWWSFCVSPTPSDSELPRHPSPDHARHLPLDDRRSPCPPPPPPPPNSLSVRIHTSIRVSIDDTPLTHVSPLCISIHLMGIFRSVSGHVSLPRKASS